MCPAAPRAPRITSPSRTWQPPIPVPTAISSIEERPAPTPERASPRPWACTSFRTATGTPKRSAKGPARSVPAQAVSDPVACVTRPRSVSITPAEAMPTARSRGLPRTCSDTSRAAAMTASGPAAAGVARVATSSMPPGPTSAAAMLVPPMSSASTGCSGTGALQQPRLLEDGPDPRHDLRVVDGGHRCGHHIGRQHSQLPQGRLEGAHAGGRPGLPDGLEDDLEQGRQTFLLGPDLLPVARPRRPVHPHVTARIDVAQPRDGARGPGQVGTVDDHLVTGQQGQRGTGSPVHAGEPTEGDVVAAGILHTGDHAVGAEGDQVLGGELGVHAHGYVVGGR